MAHQYKIQRYEKEALSSSENVAKSYDMAKRLSKNFTTDNDTAIKMDAAVYESLVLDGKVKEQTTSSASQNLTPMMRTPNTTKPPGSDKLTSSVKPLLAKKASGRLSKVGFDDLDSDLKKKLSEVQVIQYHVPNQPLGPKVAKSNIPAFQKIVDDVILGQNVYLVGGAGTGKTTLAQNVSAALGREYMTINCSQWTAPTEIIGGQTLDGYQEGKLIEAWKNGYILILDELPKIDPNTAGLFNDALAKSKIPNSLIFNSRKEKFAKHPNFAVIATGNIWPNTESLAYGANNKQDLSLLDRFAGSVYSIEKNTELEIHVVGSHRLWNWCSELRRLIEELKYEAQISLRFMMTCRDTLLLEFQRLKGGQSGITADEGKTLKDCFMSFIESNFTEVQRKTIMDKFGTAGSSTGVREPFRLFTDLAYRQEPFYSILCDDFKKSGYLSDKGLSGLGNLDTGLRRYWDGN